MPRANRRPNGETFFSRVFSTGHFGGLYLPLEEELCLATDPSMFRHAREVLGSNSMHFHFFTFLPKWTQSTNLKGTTVKSGQEVEATWMREFIRAFALLIHCVANQCRLIKYSYSYSDSTSRISLKLHQRTACITKTCPAVEFSQGRKLFFRFLLDLLLRFLSRFCEFWPETSSVDAHGSCACAPVGLASRRWQLVSAINHPSSSRFDWNVTHDHDLWQ